MIDSLFSFLLYPIHLVLFFVFLIYVGYRFKLNNGYLCEVSGLGVLSHAYHKLYNFGYFIFGLLSIVFTYNLGKVLPSSIFSDIAISFLYISDLSLCFIALFPRDTFPKTHMFYSFTLFLFTELSFILLIRPFLDSTLIPNVLIILNVVICIFLNYYTYLKVRNILKYGMNNDLENIVSIWEWIPFLLTILWCFILSVIILIHLI